MGNVEETQKSNDDDENDINQVDWHKNNYTNDDESNGILPTKNNDFDGISVSIKMRLYSLS